MKNIKFYFFFFLTAVFVFAQDTPSIYVTGGDDLNAINAAQEFRIGIHAFNRYAFNEAIMSFERALSYRPGEAVIMDWLGKSYYRSGFENTALNQWRAAALAYGQNSEQGLITNSRIQTVANRRILLPVADDGVRYIESGRYPGRNNNVVMYRQPTSILPQNDGSAWLVAYGSNELVRIDVNGVIRERKRGPLAGFDRPYDLVRGLDGRMYLSEYRGGRVSILSPSGDWLAYIGSKGIGQGEFVGPQNLTVDNEGYLYVVDYGNQRISKFDPEGVFILSFGRKNDSFPGLLSPTGIAVKDSVVYAADSFAKCIYMFDPNGSYLGLFADKLLGPESLRFLSDGSLLVADTNRILQINTDTAIIRTLGLAGNERVRIAGTDMDANGNVLAANFNASEVSVLTRFDDLSSGLFVQIERINAENFPAVTLDVRVEDRLRRPIVGLEELNFFLSERGQRVNEQVFHIPSFRSESGDVSVLFERSDLTSSLTGDFAQALLDINSALGSGGNIVSVISAGEQPQRERHENSLSNAARGNTIDYNNRWRFDLGLRLAATDLLANEKKSVVYVGSGSLGGLAFEQYSLNEMAAYLANNGIIFNAVIVGQGDPCEEILYLCRETGGMALPLYRPQGIKEMIETIAIIPSGVYYFSYQSNLPTDFGRAWLPVEIEVYLLESSGRDISGYFPPLE